MPRRSGLIQARGPRRLTNWGAGPGGSAGQGFSASGAAILGGGVQFGSAGTVVRIRGSLSAFLSSYTSAGDGFHCAIGVGLASLAAFTVGIGSLPTPITELGWDGWLWHRLFDVHGSLAAGSTAVGVANSGVDIEVDSKAMRKVSDEMVVFAAAEVVEAGTAAMTIHFDSRMLLKEG